MDIQLNIIHKLSVVSRFAFFSLAVLLSISALLLLPFSRSEAAIARENSATCGNNGDTTLECSITAPSNGNALVAVIGMRGAASVNSITQTGATWSQAVRTVNGDIAMEIWYVVDVSGAGTTVAFNLNSNEKSSAVIAEYSDVTDIGALDVTATNTGTGTTVSSGTTGTTSQAEQVWIGGFASVSNDTYSDPTNGFGIVGQEGSGGGPQGQRSQATMLDRIVSETGTANTGATLSGSNDWAGGIITLNGNPIPTQITITTPPRTLTAGVCNGSGSVVTIEVQDSGGSPLAPADGTTVRMSSSSPDYTIFSDATCTTEATNGDFVFNGSQSSRDVYIIDRRASNPTWTLSANYQAGPDILTSDSQSYTLNPGATSRLVVTLPGQSFTAGTGNSGSPGAQTAGSSFSINSLTATDDYFNITTSYAGTRTITYSGPSNAPNGTTPSYTTSVDFSNGQSTTTLTTTLYNAESTTITADDSGQYGFISSSFNVTPGLLDNFLVSADTPIIAGTCTSTNSVQARDTWNNNRDTDSSTVNMTSSGVGVIFYTDSGCGTSTSQYTLTSGSSDVFYRTERKQSGMTITATKSGDVQTGTSDDITVHPAEVSTLLTILPGQSFTDGSGVTGPHSFSGLRSPNATAGTNFSIDLRAVDEFNNLVDSGPNDYSGAKTLDYSNSTAGQSPSGTSPNFPSTSISFSNGSANNLSATYFSANTSRTFRADDTGASITGTVSSTFTVQSNEATDYIVEPAGATQTAGSTFNVQVIAVDGWENQLGSLYSPPSGTYVWSTTASVSPDSTAPSIGTLSQGDFSNGIATKPVTLFMEESGVTFTAEEPSPSTVAGTSGTITVQSGSISADPGDSFITADGTVNENESLNVTITLRDAWHNPKVSVPPANIVVHATGPATITQPSSATNSSGQTTASVAWSTRGEYDVSVEIDGIALVQGDGTTPDTDGFLDDIHNVEVIPPDADARIRGGATIRGGTTIQ